MKARYIALTLLAALVLNLFALPGVLQQIRPDFIALTLIYWVVYHPRRVGFLPAWILGLIMDVADGSLFAQHALAYTVLMYLAILLYRRIVMFGMRHQILHVLAILIASQLVMLCVRLMAGSFPGLLCAVLAGRGVTPVARDPRSAAWVRPGCCLDCVLSPSQRAPGTRPIVLGRPPGGRDRQKNCTTSSG